MANEPIDTPVVDTPADGSAAAATTPVSLKDEDIVEVVWKGEKVLKPWKQAKAEIQMQEDYTRSKQELAKQAKELKELYDGLNTRSASVAEKEAALDRILGRTPANEPAKGPADDDVPTVGNVKALLAEALKGFRGEVDTTIKGVSQQTQETIQFQRFETLTNEAMDALTKEHPLLSKIPQLDMILKKEALKEKPENEKQMVQALVKAGKALAKTFDDDYTERRKAELVKKQDLIKNAPLSGGSPSFKAPEGKNYIKKGSRNKIDWDAIEKDAIEAAEGAE